MTPLPWGRVSSASLHKLLVVTPGTSAAYYEGMGSRAISTLAALMGLAGCKGADMSRSEQGIIGGVADTHREFVVMIGNDSQGPLCSAVFVSRQTILSAAHCLDQSITKVFLGPDARSPTSTLVITSSLPHPGYTNAIDLIHDLAVFKVAQADPVQPAPLLRELMDTSSTYIGPDFTFVGHGVTDPLDTTGTTAFIRRAVRFPIDFLGPAAVGGNIGNIDSSQLAYLSIGKNQCNGDSGGPSLLRRSGVERVAAITSAGDAACEQGLSNRADQLEITTFIQGAIDTFEGADPCRANGVCQESCNTATQLVDVDCAPDHCGADGMCVLSCVEPIDPDCGPGTDYCGADTLCDTRCATQDPDCPEPPTPDAGVDAPAPVDAAVDATPDAPPDAPPAPDAAVDAAVGPDAPSAGPDAGVPSTDDGGGEVDAPKQGGCTTTHPTSPPLPLALLAGAAWIRRRVRQRRAT